MNSCPDNQGLFDDRKRKAFKILEQLSYINFLAHGIRISGNLPWDRKSNLIHAILPRLSCEGYIQWLYWNSCTESSCKGASKRIQGLLEAFLKLKNSGVQEKESIIRVRLG